MKCNQCGTEFEGKFCPECGAKVAETETITPPPIPQPLAQTPPPPNEQPASKKKAKSLKRKKPFFLRWWFILLAIIIIAAINRHFSDSPKSNDKKVEWSEIKLGNIIPAPPTDKGTLRENSDEKLRVSFSDVSDDEYNNYLDACKDKGFIIDADKTSYSYKAYNSDGYYLDIHYATTLSIQLSTPMELGNITWPTGTAGQLLPAPKSTLGKFSFERDDGFYVYVGATSKADYQEYVTICSDKGFKIDYEKNDTYYRADNVDGWHISLCYEGGNIMSIRIDAPDKEENSNNSTEDGTLLLTPEPTQPSAKDDDQDNDIQNNPIGLSPDFKTAMDSYEAFMDEYITFMQKYSQSEGSNLSLLNDYAKYLKKYTEFCDDFAKWEDEEMNAVETAYYIEVQLRVNKKLLEASGSENTQ